mgnify:CR=1 FL=1
MNIYNKFFKLSFWGPELSFERQERHQTEHAVLCLHRQGAAVLLHDAADALNAKTVPPASPLVVWGRPSTKCSGSAAQFSMRMSSMPRSARTCRPM